jgi:ABC-type glycerol-3-phosphate transport system substrate-binding protein
MNQRFRNVQVELEQYPSSEYVTKIVALTAGGTQPDVLEYSDVPFFEAAHKGVCLDLDPFLQRDRRAMNADDFFWRGGLLALGPADWPPQPRERRRTGDEDAGQARGRPMAAGG